MLMVNLKVDRMVSSWESEETDLHQQEHLPRHPSPEYHLSLISHQLEFRKSLLFCVYCLKSALDTLCDVETHFFHACALPGDPPATADGIWQALRQGAVQLELVERTFESWMMRWMWCLDERWWIQVTQVKWALLWLSCSRPQAARSH